MKKWKNVYKKVVEINGNATLCVYFIPRYSKSNSPPLFQRIRLSIAELLITPFLLTKEEHAGIIETEMYVTNLKNKEKIDLVIEKHEQKLHRA